MPNKVCELVSLTHQRTDTLVSDNERVVVNGNARSVGPSASVAPMPAQRWTDIGTAVDWPHCDSTFCQGCFCQA